MHALLKLITLSLMSFFAATASAQSPYVLSAMDKVELMNHKAVIHVWRDKARSDSAIDVFGAIDITASPEVIWNIMTDCSRGNSLVKGMLSCSVLESHPEGHYDIREQVFDMGLFLPNVKTQFRSEYVPLKSITLRRIGGDLKIQDTLWTFTDLGNGSTRVTYRGTLLLKFPVPRGLLQKATRKDTPQILRNLRATAEQDSQRLLAFTQGPTLTQSTMP